MCGWSGKVLRTLIYFWVYIFTSAGKQKGGSASQHSCSISTVVIHVRVVMIIIIYFLFGTIIIYHTFISVQVSNGGSWWFLYTLISDWSIIISVQIKPAGKFSSNLYNNFGLAFFDGRVDVYSSLNYYYYFSCITLCLQILYPKPNPT